ncbi:MAG: cold shock domain-containing protein [Methyloprofundus sp.]|nr:cold shock domain-containing protein [Methyloprofundus sp.]
MLQNNKTKGTVTKYFRDNGYGFIVDEKGIERFFHISSAPGHMEIARFSEVSFEPDKNDRGDIAINITVTSIPESVENMEPSTIYQIQEFGDAIEINNETFYLDEILRYGTGIELINQSTKELIEKEKTGNTLIKMLKQIGRVNKSVSTLNKEKRSYAFIILTSGEARSWHQGKIKVNKIVNILNKKFN